MTTARVAEERENTGGIDENTVQGERNAVVGASWMVETFTQGMAGTVDKLRSSRPVTGRKTWQTRGRERLGRRERIGEDGGGRVNYIRVILQFYLIIVMILQNGYEK